MTTFSFSSGTPSNLVGGHAASMSDISGSLTDLQTFLNGGNIDTTNLATSAKPATLKGDYRTIAEASSIYDSTVASGVKQFAATSNGFQLLASGTSGAAVRPLCLLDVADYAVSGLTAKLRLRGVVATNATAPTATFTLGLYPVTVAGASSSIAVTLGTVTSGSTIAFAAPAASTATTTAGSDFTFPSAGVYTIGVNITGTIAGGGIIGAVLQLRYV